MNKNFNQKIYSFFGCECINIYFYLMESWKIEGLKILINDNTDLREVFNCFQLSSDSVRKETYQFRKVDFGRKISQDKWFKYDVILNICGYIHNEEIEKLSDEIYVICDLQKSTVSKVSTYIKEMQQNYSFIWIIEEGQNYDYRRIQFGLKKEHCIEDYIIELSPGDNLNKLLIQYNGIFKEESSSQSLKGLVQIIKKTKQASQSAKVLLC